nr:capsid protein [Otarine picobirnavirus]
MANKRYANKNKSKFNKDKSRMTGDRDSRSITKGRSFEEKMADPKIHRSESNDPAWYMQWPSLAQSAANIPMNRLPGTPLHVSSGPKNLQIPGMMSIGLLPSIGWSYDQTDAPNVMANAIYNYVRHVNSGHSNYDAPDLMMYILAVTNLVGFHSWMRRCYGTLRLISPTNRYYPKVCAAANGIDYNDFISHMADFRFYIDNFALRMGTFVVPGVMPLVARQSFAFSGMYLDENDPKGQLYQYQPIGFYRLDAYGENGTTLKFEKFPDEAFTLATLSAYGDKLLAPLVANEDFAIMSGDILKAFGDGGIIHLSMTDEDYVVMPSHDTMVLEQIANTRTIPYSDMDAASLDITQDPKVGGGAIRFTPVTTTEHADIVDRWLGHELMLNFHTDNVDVPFIMDATRNTIGTIKAKFSDLNSGAERVYLKAVGTEIPIETKIYTISEDGLNYETVTLSMAEGFDMKDGQTLEFLRTWTKSKLKIFSLVSSFNYHPVVQTGVVVGESGEGDYFTSLWDFNNYTMVNIDDIHRIHQVAIYSEMTIPMAVVTSK